jgi:hypothetical protein
MIQPSTPEAAIALDPLQVWPGAEELVKKRATMFAVNRGGVGMDTKSPVYATAPDPLEKPSCLICLCRWVDGSPITVRHYVCDIKLVETPSEYKMLDYFYHRGI